MNVHDFEKLVFEQLKTKGNLYFRAKITPSAPKIRFLSVLEDADDLTVKVAVNAPPEKGKANKALCRFLSKYFDCQTHIVSGQKSQLKLIQLSR